MDDCKKIQELLPAYADGELDGRERALVAEHVASCPHCAALLDEYLALNEALADCAVPAPKDFADRVMGAVKAEQTSRASRGVRLGKIAPYLGIAAAAVLCICIVGSGLVQRMGQIFDNGESVDPEWQTAAGAPDPAPEDGFAGGAESAEMATDYEKSTMDDAVTEAERDTYEESLAETETEAATNMESIESPTYPETAQDGIESEPVYDGITTQAVTAAPEESETETESETESETETESDTEAEEGAGEQDA